MTRHLPNRGRLRRNNSCISLSNSFGRYPTSCAFSGKIHRRPQPVDILDIFRGCYPLARYQSLVLSVLDFGGLDDSVINGEVVLFAPGATQAAEFLEHRPEHAFVAKSSADPDTCECGKAMFWTRCISWSCLCELWLYS